MKEIFAYDAHSSNIYIYVCTSKYLLSRFTYLIAVNCLTIVNNMNSRKVCTCSKAHNNK